MRSSRRCRARGGGLFEGVTERNAVRFPAAAGRAMVAAFSCREGCDTQESYHGQKPPKDSIHILYSAVCPVQGYARPLHTRSYVGKPAREIIAGLLEGLR